MNSVIERELREQLDQLPADQQRQVLDFARALAVKKHATASGKALSQFGGAITKENTDLAGVPVEVW